MIDPFDSSEVEPEWTADELTEEEWRLFVAQGLQQELNEPREDIYSLDS